MPAAWVAAGASLINAFSGSDSGSSGQNTANQSAGDAGQIARDQWNYYTQNYQPLETNLIGQAQAAGSPEEFARARGAANADVTGAFDASRKQTQSRMESYGINPGSPAYQSALASTDLAEGATKAGALTAADNNTRNLAYSKALDVVGLGRNIPAQSAASAANAANAGTAAGKLAFARNQSTMQNTGYAANTIGNVASKWFNTPTSSSSVPSYNSTTSSSGGFYDSGNYGNAPTDSGQVVPYSKGGLVATFADGGEVDRESDLTDKDGWKSSQQPAALGKPQLRFAGVGRPRLQIPTGDRNAKLEASIDIGVHNGGLQLKRGGIVYRKTFADGGAVIDAEKTGDGEYDATPLKGVLQKRGLSPAVAHREAHGVVARHKGAITPHMRRFAGGGGVGRQGLEAAGPDASNMGDVQGPGTETSDSVPAQIDGEKPAALSTGEFVMNAEVPKLSGDEILKAINDYGLKKRGQGIEPRTSSDVAANDGAQAYAEGGAVQADVRRADRYRPSEMPATERRRVSTGAHHEAMQKVGEFMDDFEKRRASTGEITRRPNEEMRKAALSALQRSIDTDEKDAPHQYASGGRVSRYGLGR